MYTGVAVANYFISKFGDQHDVELSPMKLVKLVYIAHGWHLGILKQPLLDENPEAWKYGPVIASLYHETKSYGHRSVRTPILSTLAAKNVEPNSTVSTLLDKVWEVYGKKTAIQLSTLTHQPGTPWYKTWYDLGGSYRHHTQIPDSLILDYYTRKAEDSAEKTRQNG